MNKGVSQIYKVTGHRNTILSTLTSIKMEYTELFLRRPYCSLVAVLDDEKREVRYICL